MNTAPKEILAPDVCPDCYHQKRICRCKVMRGVQLFRLPVGTVFNDFYGKQVFIKEAELQTKRGKRHRLRCIVSPFAKTGPISSAFFCGIGQRVYREGSLRVFPLTTDRFHEILFQKEAA